MMFAKQTRGRRPGFFEILASEVGDVVVLNLMGQFGQSENSDHLIEVIEAKLAQGRKAFVLNCSSLEVVSSYGVGLLIRAYVAATEAKARLLYCEMPARVKRSFDACTQHSPLQGLVFASCQEALQELDGPL